MPAAPFPDRVRVDALGKVTGRTAYAADVPVPGLLHAMTVPAAIVKGRVTAIDSAAALRVPGVVRVLTWRDFAGAKSAGALASGGFGFQAYQPMLDDSISYRGEPVALVVARTLEAAVEAATLIRASYEPVEFAATMDQPGAVRNPIPPVGVKFGDADAAYAAAPVKVAVEYDNPAQFQNPMEMISTTAVWKGGQLTVYEGSQNTGSTKFGIATALGLDPAVVHVKSPYLGGGFGQKNSLQSQTVIVARAAMLLGRPVKLVMPRGQLFHNASFRPASRHKIGLAATADGKMVAARYDAEHQNARSDTFGPNYHEVPARQYGVPNYTGTGAVLRIDTQSPGFMRAPWEHAACFAFEGAVDELAARLGRDPVLFRLENDTARDPENGKPFSSRFLAECLRQGADRFGWSRRSAAPGSMVASDGHLIGWGMATGAYKTSQHPTVATLRVSADGTSRFSVSGHEMGQGIRNAITAVLASRLAIDPARLDLRIGDTDAAPQHVTAGSWGTVSTVVAAESAARRMLASVSELLAGRTPSGNLHRQLASVRRPFVEVEVSEIAPGQKPPALERLRTGLPAAAGPEYPDYTTMSYIAHFVEVRVEPRTRRVRVPRVVSVADCGRVVSPRTATSQMRGGIVWAIGAALREGGEVDPRYGGVLNSDLADYVVPVNADIGEIDVSFIDRPDPLMNAVGAKGLGEVSMIGAASAILNAVHHATGRRLRRLPARVEDLL